MLRLCNEHIMHLMSNGLYLPNRNPRRSAGREAVRLCWSRLDRECYCKFAIRLGGLKYGLITISWLDHVWKKGVL